MTAVLDPCGNERCMKCYPNLKTFDVRQTRLERVTSHVSVRAETETEALDIAAAMVDGPGGYCFDSTDVVLELGPREITLDRDPRYESCYHDLVYPRHPFEDEAT